MSTLEVMQIAQHASDLAKKEAVLAVLRLRPDVAVALGESAGPRELKEGQRLRGSMKMVPNQPYAFISCEALPDGDAFVPAEELRHRCFPNGADVWFTYRAGQTGKSAAASDIRHGNQAAEWDAILRDGTGETARGGFNNEGLQFLRKLAFKEVQKNDSFKKLRQYCEAVAEGK